MCLDPFQQSTEPHSPEVLSFLFQKYWVELKASGVPIKDFMRKLHLRLYRVPDSTALNICISNCLSGNNMSSSLRDAFGRLLHYTETLSSVCLQTLPREQVAYNSTLQYLQREEGRSELRLLRLTHNQLHANWRVNGFQQANWSKHLMR